MNETPLPRGNFYDEAGEGPDGQGEVCWRGEHPLTEGESVVRTAFGRVACVRGFWRHYGIDHETGQYLEGRGFDENGCVVVAE